MKPVVVIDPQWRRMGELFAPEDIDRLGEAYEIVWGQDGPLPAEVLEEALPRATAIVAATPEVDAATLARAPELRAIVEVSGAFPASIDYPACFERGIEVLSCSPGFRESVAEMGVAMMLAGARGLMREHEAFRDGTERWLEDYSGTDFTLYGGKVGFLGFGQIAQEMTRLIAPFGAEVRAFDPWLPEPVAADYGIALTDLDALLDWSRCLVVVAVPTSENKGLLNAERLARLGDKSLVVLLSRSHLVDWPDLMAEVDSGRLTAAIDVFPSEPADPADPVRMSKNVILSPHRAAAVDGGRRLIGRMLTDDLLSLVEGRPERRLSRADPAKVASLAGVGDAVKVAEMAEARQID
ncbi:MAG: NAD(P)-dependent oxidoreductase [Paracoccaceae bacterium]|nr:NAD(P)-dependent oxidoreductase [Paracoccaceae bacterium]